MPGRLVAMLEEWFPKTVAWHRPQWRRRTMVIFAVGGVLGLAGNLLFAGRTFAGAEAAPGGALMELLIAAAVVPWQPVLGSGLVLLVTAAVLYHWAGPREGIVSQPSRGGPVKVDLARQRRSLPLFFLGLGILIGASFLGRHLGEPYGPPTALGGIVVGLGLILGWVFASRATPHAHSPHHSHALPGTGPTGETARDLRPKRLALFALLGIVAVVFLTLPVILDVLADGGPSEGYSQMTHTYWQVLDEGGFSGNIPAALLGSQSWRGPEVAVPEGAEHLNLTTHWPLFLLDTSLPEMTLEFQEAGGEWRQAAAGTWGSGHTESIDIPPEAVGWRITVEHASPQERRVEVEYVHAAQWQETCTTWDSGRTECDAVGSP